MPPSFSFIEKDAEPASFFIEKPKLFGYEFFPSLFYLSNIDCALTFWGVVEYIY